MNTLTPVQEVRQKLGLMEPEFKMALPPHVSVEKFIRVTITALQNNPDLVSADRQSLYSATMKAATDGLIPDNREAALVVFKGKDGPKVQYLPMVRGLLKLARNSGEIALIASHVVKKNDRFRYWIDSQGEHIEHEPLLVGERGEMLGVYALAKTKDGSVYIEFLSREQIDKVKSKSRAKEYGPWVDWPEEMAQKTAIKRICKRLPMSTDLEHAIEADDEIYDVTPQKEETAPETTPKRLTSIIESETTKEEVPL